MEFSSANLESQSDEIEALSAIYEEKWKVVDPAGRVYRVSVGNNPINNVHLSITLPPNYPSDSPPYYELGAPWMKADLKKEISDNLQEIYLENLGENIIFLWVEKIQEFLNKIDVENYVATVPEYDAKQVIVPEYHQVDVIHGEPIVDRKSTFQAHLIKVKSIKDVENAIGFLKTNKKISNATHNILAYRFNDSAKNCIVQDCNDDGEHAAGGRLLHLLQILEARDVLVVVSRWYGGILLGPDRFKHINNVARTLLVENGFNKSPQKRGK